MRASALHRRHLLREQRAQDTYAASRNPVRGWPVADNHVVMAFFRGLLRERKGIFVLADRANALAAGTALVVPAAARQPGQPHRRRRQPALELTSSTTSRWADRRRRLHAGGADLPGAADLDDLRSGPAVVGARVHRRHRAAAAAGPGRGCVHRRPGHPRDPRRRHDEPIGAVRRAAGDHLRADRRAVGRRDAAELGPARGAVACW